MPNLERHFMTYIIFGAVVLLLIIISWVIRTLNRFKVLLVKIREADSGIDVALTKRYDTLTKQLDVVKAYAKHESELFEKVIKLRAGMSISEKNAANREMDTLSGRIKVVAENYPALRSSENFKALQAAIADAEDHLQAARRVYNMNVSAFNQAIVLFPASMIAGGGGYRAMEFFIAEESKRADVKMSF
ncbi:MAG: LemA family protein [Oscillospiraceae bacterium]|jgi:LemA protein|nr:LemA family protein [Oscillospiraceae bacterium]